MEALASNMTTIDMTSKDGEKVKMTKDEMQRFRKCMDDPKFVSLWQDYAQEISDPANLKEQEEYLQQVEREANEKGDYSFTFIFPKPCFCVRINTKDSRFFVNICDDEKVDEPVEETTGDRQASSWQVPISLGKIRDADHGDKPCKVVDACFHPKATYLARSSDKFMVFLVEIAVENINHNYHAEKKEIPHALPTEFRRLTDVQSIGNPAAQTIRIKAVAGKEGELVVEPKKPKVPSPKAKDAFKDADAGFADRLAASMGNAEAKARLQRERDAEAARKAAEAAEAAAAAQREAEAEKARAAEFKRNLQAGFAGAGQKKDEKKMPEYTIVHQGDIGYQDCFNESHRPERKLPKSLRVTMALPQVAKATELDMSIEAEAISLACERHGIEGEIALPFQIDPDRAAAKFDKTKRILTITLPVVPKQSAFEIAYSDEERARRAAFREEAARQAAEEAAVRAEEEAAAAAERAAEEAAEKAKKEEREAARRAVEARLERLAAEKKEADAAEKAKREAELARKHEETLKKKMAALEKTKLTMAEQEEACRAEAESEHQKSLRKIKKEMEALKLAESMLHESRKKQQEMPFTNQYVLEMD